MNCNEHLQLISKLMDGELSQSESPIIFRHLAECTECGGFYHQLQMLNASLDRIAERLPDIAAAESYIPHFLSPLKPQPWWDRRVPLRLPVLVLLLWAIAVGMFFSLSHFHEPETVYVTKLPPVIITTETATLSPKK